MLKEDNESLKRSNKSGRKKIRVIIFSVLAIVIIASAFLGIRMLTAPKSAREFYLKAEGKQLEAKITAMITAYDEFKSQQQKYIVEPNHRRTEITMDISGEGSNPFGLTNSVGVFDLLNKSKLIFDMRNYPKTGALANISLLIDRSPIIDIKTNSRDNRMFFTIPVIIPDRYYSVSTLPNDLENTYKRFNIPVKPKRFPAASDIASSVNFSQSDIRQVMTEYGTILANFIEEKDVAFTKKSSMQEENTQNKVKEVIVTFSPEKAKATFKNLLEQVARDERLLNLTYSNAAKLSDIFDQWGAFQLVNALEDWKVMALNNNIKTFINGLNFKENKDNFKKQLLQTANNMSFPEGIKMTVTVDSNNNIVYRDLSVIYKNGNPLAADVPANKLVLRTSPSKLNLNYDKLVNSKSEFGLTVGLILTKGKDEATMKDSSSIKYNFIFTGEDKALSDKINGEILTLFGHNDKLKTKNASTTLWLNTDMQSFDVGKISFKLRFANEDRFIVEPYKPLDIKESAVLQLDKASDAELQQELQKVLASFGTFYVSNKALFDVF